MYVTQGPASKSVFIILQILHIIAGSLFNQRDEQCTDIFDSGTCYKWFMYGMCKDNNFIHIAENCKRTCNRCPTVITKTLKKKRNNKAFEEVCKDEDSDCLSWQNQCQEGSEFYDFMQTNCRRTCHFCVDKNCKDRINSCKAYRNQGFCRINNPYHNYTKKYCEKTCGYCLNYEKETMKEKEKKENKKAFERVFAEKTRKILRQPKYVKEFPCDFEIDECDWSNQIFDDTGDWSVGIHRDGPKRGYNNSKNYL